MSVIKPFDAELIELGARFEPLLDQYYGAQRRWSESSEQTYHATADALHEIHDEMKPAGECHQRRASQLD
jgi:hypothetical protein